MAQSLLSGFHNCAPYVRSVRAFRTCGAVESHPLGAAGSRLRIARWRRREEHVSSLAIYLIGFTLVIVGLAWGAFTLGAPPLWIGIGTTILVGIGIVTGVSKTRYREASSHAADTTRLVLRDD